MNLYQTYDLLLDKKEIIIELDKIQKLINSYEENYIKIKRDKNVLIWKIATGLPLLIYLLQQFLVISGNGNFFNVLGALFICVIAGLVLFAIWVGINKLVNYFMKTPKIVLDDELKELYNKRDTLNNKKQDMLQKLQLSIVPNKYHKTYMILEFMSIQKKHTNKTIDEIIEIYLSTELKNDYKERKTICRDEIYKDLLSDSKKYYFVKKSIFELSEQKIYYFINQKLKEYNNYFVFPKVRLADIIGVDKKQQEIKEIKDVAVPNITSKHIDYVICKRYFENGDMEKAMYKPCLLIELDGNSHKGEKQAKNDNFKNQVLSNLDIKFVRIKFTDEIDSSYREKINKLIDEELC